MNIGKCPKCDKTVTSVRLEDVEVTVGFESRWRGITYCCPWCSAVLSVQIDPVALKTDIIQGIADRLGMKSP